MRILLVEDQKRVSNFIKKGLEEEGYAVDVASDGEAGLERALVNPYDLMIFDVMLPEKDGITLCREVRTHDGEVPILMLTAKGAVKDKVSGLNAGADDYLLKPFEFEELLARVRALLRRKTKQTNTLLEVGDLTLDQITHEVKRAGKPIELTSKEYALLQYLMQHAGQVVTRTMISEHVWNENFDSFTNVIDVYINYLRKKVEEGFNGRLIHTIRGTGYVFKADDA